MVLFGIMAISLPEYYSGAPKSEKVPSPYPQFGVFSPGTIEEVPPNAGRRMIEALGLDSLQSYQEYSLGLINELGVQWARIDFMYTGRGFDYPAGHPERLHDSGLDVVGCIRLPDNYAPDDYPAFQKHLRTLVDSYPWINVWQLGNEINMQPQSLGAYPAFFAAGSTVVREACPGCRIALAGVAPRYPNRQQAAATYSNLIAVIAAQAPGSRPAFDIFDMHFYGSYGSEQEMLGILGDYRNMLERQGINGSVSMWVTETATYTGRPLKPKELPFQTEAQQATELVRRFTVLLAAGTERVSWARPYENYLYDGLEDGYYDNAGLVYNGLGWEAGEGVAAGTRKKSFFAYRTLISRLAGYLWVQQLAAGQTVFYFSDRGPVYVLWGQEGSSLPGGISGEVTVTDIEGGGQTLDAADVRLGPVPIFVESR
mgnify:CR=1 FL=1